MDIDEALALLDEESEELDRLVSGLSDEQWSLPTPAAGWTIAHQIGHLTWTDEVSVHTVTGSPAFAEAVAGVTPTTTDDTAAERAGLGPAELLAAWRLHRGRLAEALAAADPAEKIAWFGPPMRPVTMATARIMETWAHGLDVHDALGRPKPPGPALAAVARIGFRTRDFAFRSNGLEPPAEEFRVSLTMPDGSPLQFGDPDAAQTVTGTADAFCRVVTQRRHPDDVGLVAAGPDARTWLTIAQAFAGDATPVPDAGTRTLPGEATAAPAHPSAQEAP